MVRPHLVIFTDLDGTLLDHHSYSWREAAEALEETRRRQIPVVFCTSKTRAEVEFLRRKMEIHHPFITENGGGIFVPHGYFRSRIPAARTVKTFHCLALASPYEEMTAALEEISAAAGAQTVGFHQMRVKEIAENSGLPQAQAELARLRDFDLPFFFAGASPEAEQRFTELARRQGIEVTRGDRFWHLHRGSNKGRAVRELMKLYRADWRTKLRCIGLGDAPNDLPMLAAVDLPILVAQHTGRHDQIVVERLPEVRRTSLPGPAGWNEAVLDLLAE